MEDKEKDTEYNDTDDAGCGCGCLVIIAIIIIIAFFSSCGDSHNTKNNTTKEQKQITQITEKKQEKPLTEEDIIKDQIESATHFVDIKDVNIMKMADNEHYSIIVFAKGKDNITANQMYQSYQYGCKDIFKSLYRSGMGNKIHDVKINITADVVSKSGANTEANIYTITLKKDKAAKIKWSDIDMIDIEQVANDVIIHPALRRELMDN